MNVTLACHSWCVKAWLAFLAILPVLAFPSGTTATASEPPRNGLIAAFALEGIQLIDPAGGPASELPGTEEMSDPAWSPDGKSLALTGWSEESFAVYTMKADGSDRRLMLDNAWSPAWSPDGKRLVVVRDGCLAPYACASEDEVVNLLVTVRLDGTDERELVLGNGTTPGAVSGPEWSPDGKSIAFVDRASRIKLVDAYGEAGTVRQLATDALSVAWSPDGSKLAFDRYIETDEGSRQVVVVVDLATRKETILRGRQTGAQSPAWSPDGKQLAFLSSKSGPVGFGQCGGHVETHLWVMAPDGTNAHRLVERAYYGTPTWARSLEPAPTD